MFSTYFELIEEIKLGNIIILVDDEDRENEGDFFVAADCITPEIINFMSKYGRGLICLPLSEEKAKQIGLSPLVDASENCSQFETNFTVSIEASEGVTTGISAADRSHTILTAIKNTANKNDIVKPGHIFPIIAVKGGVLSRAGHTEASTDLAVMAGFSSSAVIVEILNDDGTMARRDDLFKISEKHQIKIGTIADLIDYRLKNEKTIRKISSQKITTDYGEFLLDSYLDSINDKIHFVYINNNIASIATNVRVHYQDDLSDILHVSKSHKSWNLVNSLKYIQKNSGVVIILSSDETSKSVHKRLKNINELNESQAKIKAIGTGSRILKEMSISKINVLGSKRKITAVSGFGIEIVSYIECEDIYQ